MYEGTGTETGSCVKESLEIEPEYPLCMAAKARKDLYYEGAVTHKHTRIQRIQCANYDREYCCGYQY